MKKFIIFIQVVTLIILLVLTMNQKAETIEGKYFIMTVTAYSRHLIADKHNDGMTASNTPIREGIAALNVDYINGRWLIKSPLNLGDKIYIEGLGNFNVEDTGYFTDVNFKQDYWNIDIFIEDYKEAVKFGRKLKKVWILKEDK